MKPLDRRLLRYARSARGVLGYGALLGLLRTIAIIAWCWALAQGIAAVALPVLGGLGGASGRIGEYAASADQLPLLLGLALVAMLVRSASSWGMDVLAARGAVRVKGELRGAALNALDARESRAQQRRSDAELATVLGRGLDALDGYFSAYLPQVILAVVATPPLVLTVLLTDVLSGITVLVVFPVIPLFMVLIGLATQAVQDRQWDQLQRLAASFLDLVTGLATLRIFRRERKQIKRIERETEEYRSRTLRVLRVTFLSGFVLDLAGTFSIALVAVTVGTRIVNGQFPLALGLFVLLLLPEVFVPIRQVGAAFHASTEGLAAATRVFDIIELQVESLKTPASRVRVTPEGVRVDSVVLARQDREIAGPITLRAQPGEVVAIAGPSGAGKTTLLGAIAGWVSPARGEIAAPEEFAWVGQRAGLLQGTVAENVALGEAHVDESEVRRLLDAVGLEEVAVDAPLGAGGSGLSGGQAQRVAIARCLYRTRVRDCRLLLLDEPTSALDRENEAQVCRIMREIADEGRTVIVVSHRPAVLAAADRVERVGVPVA